MRVAVILILSFLVSLSATASHIVGGEFELIHLSGNSYRINLILYFDELNGNPGAKDPFADVRIFRKRDNAIMVNAIRLFQNSISNVSYTQPECSKGEIVTSKIIYTSTIFLSEQQYNDPQGYYISWERCCRNYGIVNIYSEDPAVSNLTAGQTFYLEFPPVVKNGQPFINSSPRLFPPLNDYACPNKNYYVDFAGTDDDGDSLVYSLITPLTTWTADALPPGGLPRPGPYPSVQWRSGYGISNVTKGSPDLRISDDGFLTVTPPSVQGLYVFAVKCEEYRDGVKIGEVRRDFQMFVLDVCPVADPPQIVGRKKGDITFSQPNQSLSVSYTNSVADADRCVEVQISDLDSEKPEDNFQEKIRIRILPLNFKNNTRYLNELLPEVSTATLVNGSTADFTICFPECSYVPGGIYQIGIIAYDDACSLPLSDTLRISVYVEPPENNPPAFTTPNQVITINEGDPLLTIPFLATDTDLDQLDIFVLTEGFILENVGMSLIDVNTTQPGLLTGTFTWDSRCDVFDFTQKTEFKLLVMVEDRDKCLLNNRDTLTFDLTIILPGNSDPLISSDLQQADEKRIEVTRKIYETLQFTVNGTDADNDYIVLGVTGKGFNPASFNMNFPGDQNTGSVTSPFTWELNCDKINLSQKNIFELDFIVVDNANKCRFYKADTLQVIVTVEPPDNLAPQLTVESMNDLILSAGSLEAFQGEEIKLKLTGTDGDVNPQDLIRIRLASVNGSNPGNFSGFSFTEGLGTGSAEAYFTWNPDCSLFQPGVFENHFVFTFSVNDNRCFNNLTELLPVNITVRDFENEETSFLPPNVITPNGDGMNEFFAMVKLLAPGQYVNILPLDNCEGSFVNIRIYDRWGNQVFESSNRDFRWYAHDSASGVYFYFLNFTHKKFKGAVSVRF
jgi:hypothetical protein